MAIEFQSQSQIASAGKIRSIDPANAPQGNNQPSIRQDPLLRTRLKPRPAEPTPGRAAQFLTSNRRLPKPNRRLLKPIPQRPSLQLWKPQRLAHWLVAQTKARPQQSPRLKKPCQMPTEKARKKRVSLTTSRVLLWCGPSNTFAERAAYSRIANRACCIFARPRTRAIPALPYRWRLYIPAGCA